LTGLSETSRCRRIFGRSYRETDEANASFDSVVENMLTGQYNSPARVVAFNTS
jgi:hypothetical protein